MIDPKTGISEPMVTIPWWLDCREQTIKWSVLGDSATWSIEVDTRHERGCVRRYGAISETPHHECPCHKGSKYSND